MKTSTVQHDHGEPEQPVGADDIAISVRSLTKKYRIFSHPGDRIKQALTFGRIRFHNEFTALKDISFEIKKGEAIGIIGRNGSGKSTLLQLICGILKPTSGEVRVNGRISALLELGTGFTPEFTGRENVYFQGAVMGIPKEVMDARFDDIAAFADIGEYIDQPVRTYSSGMYVRLAFATMIHADADILVIDEALAVGDEAFQRKCFNRIIDMFNQQKMILFFVSHNLRQIERVCSKVFLVDHGSIIEEGSASKVCNTYHDMVYKSVHEQEVGSLRPANYTTSGEIDVREISIFNSEKDMDTSVVVMHSSVRVSIRFSCQAYLDSLEVIVGFHTTDSIYVASASTAANQKQIDLMPGEHLVECVVPDMILMPGVYHVRLAFLDRYRQSMWDGHKLRTFRVIAEANTNVMRMPQLSLVDIPFSWHIE